MEAEEQDKPDTAPDYAAQVAAGAKDPHPYDRLMIEYRKSRKYKEELALINKAIALFQKRLMAKQPQILQRSTAKGTQLKNLSQRIARFTGLADKKGNSLFVPEPIARWQKRKAVVEKKLQKKPK
jgi:hypothetical protein